MKLYEYILINSTCLRQNINHKYKVEGGGGSPEEVNSNFNINLIIKIHNKDRLWKRCS